MILRKPFGFILLAMIAVLVICSSSPSLAAAPMVKMGSVNGDVWDLQFRLNTAGYYDHKPDGNFGARTADATRRFQRDYGLVADGVVGPQTWRALKRVSVNQAELDMLAQLIHSEARGESYTGQVAVGAVVMNRLRSADFPNSIYDVIFEPRAFTAIDDGQYWLTPNATAYRAALDAVRGWDPTGGCLYYFNPQTATSEWIWSRPQIVTIGSHIFCK